MSCVCCNGTGMLEVYGTCPLCDGNGSCLAAARDNTPQLSLEDSSAAIVQELMTRDPELVEGMDPSLHYLAPRVPKPTWNALGDLVAERERNSSGSTGGERWISLRLDGSGFSRTVKVMRHKGILESEGFSEVFASCMQASLRALMEHVHARIGYTQSDEMCVFIPPANVVRGEQQPHMRNGRVTKLTTLASSFVTAHFIMQLATRCQKSGVGLEDLSTILPHFDCRLGQYSSWEEARSLLIWRAYDCSVNGVSDAVYHSKGTSDRKEAMKLGRKEKTAWLWKNGFLPLPRHQAYGSVFVKVKRAVDGHNPKLGTTVKTLRGVIERVDGPILELVRTGKLFPVDDELLA